MSPTLNLPSRDSSVGIALGYGLDDRGSRVWFPAGARNFFTTASRTALGPTHPPIHWVPGALSLGVKQLGREADHSPPSSAVVKNPWSLPPLPHYVFMAWCLVKNRDNFILNLYLTKLFIKRPTDRPTNQPTNQPTKSLVVELEGSTPFNTNACHCTRSWASYKHIPSSQHTLQDVS
jgi:hypothetical protein